ncbi:MAG: M20/M25/M40 family metallo-hydrolase [Deltaproteobacteria bacterium]|nr:M20/M25/M40 family metallo-hydrolase [Deltaproteobacteria bacterium]
MSSLLLVLLFSSLVASTNSSETKGMDSGQGYSEWEPEVSLGRSGEATTVPDPVEFTTLEVVQNLQFQQFKNDIEALAGFGDRRRNTRKNLLAGLWIEEQLESMGYAVERHAPTGEPGVLKDNIYVTKVGTRFPDRMYIVSAHFDGRGGGGAADDDASGSALVLEAARALASDRIQTETSIRFLFWNFEEASCFGSRHYVEDRRKLQGIEDPPGSGLYPEPRWLGVIQHDMILYDHGLPPGEHQSLNADLDIEYDSEEVFSEESLALARFLLSGNASYSTDYPAEIGPDMCCTDSRSFDSYTAAVSVRENRRLSEIGRGSNPHYHQPTDLFSNYSEADFLLGFNALQMTLGTVCKLAQCKFSELLVEEPVRALDQ